MSIYVHIDDSSKDNKNPCFSSRKGGCRGVPRRRLERLAYGLEVRRVIEDLRCHVCYNGAIFLSSYVYLCHVIQLGSTSDLRLDSSEGCRRSLRKSVPELSPIFV